MNIELYLLKWFYSWTVFRDYGSYVEERFLKDNSAEIHRLFTTIGQFHSRYPETDIVSTTDLRLLYLSLFPSVAEQQTEVVELLFSKLDQITVQPDVAKDFLNQHRKRSKATELSLLALEVGRGSKDFQTLLNGIQDIQEIDKDVGPEVSEFVTVSEDGGFPPVGLRWRLQSLNRSIGSLRKGDNGVLHARPEAGKTTFALSEATFMAEQLEKGPCIYFNNEQPGELMYYRAVQAFLGIDTETFFKYKSRAIQKYKAKLGELFRIYDSAHMARRDVERICRIYNPALLVFDQLPKIKGFSDDRKDLELGAVFNWQRELAKEYGPTIGLCQTGGSGEGKKWLDMNDINDSKTAIQAEADWIAGVGKSHQEGLENIRFFSISKNKLLGDPDTDPSLRHGKFEALINAPICRFEDIST